MTENPKKYRLYDLQSYDGKIQGEVFADDDLREVRKAVKAWEIAVHGECDLIIQKWSDTYSVYVLYEKL